jgi:predicted nucleic acid-binding protein
VLGTVRQLCNVLSLTPEHHDKGLDIAERYRFSFYDSIIVASALLADCKTLYSEDLQHRQVLERQLEVINPFV